MKNETPGPFKKKGLSATAPVFKFAGRKGVPTEAQVAGAVTEPFPRNRWSQGHTGQVKGKEEKQEKEGRRGTREKEEKGEKKGKEEKLVTEDDLFLAALLLEGETDDLLQQSHPFAVSITNWMNTYLPALEKKVTDPSQLQNGELSNGLGPGTWGQHPVCTSANLMGVQQQHPGVGSGPLVKYTGNQRSPYLVTPGHNYPIGPGLMLPGLGPRPLYSQVHNAPGFSGGPQGCPQGPNVGFYHGTEMVPFSHATFLPPYAPFSQHPGFPPQVFALSQEMSQLHALQNEMSRGKRSRNVSNEHSPGKGGSSLPPLLDLDFPERYEQEGQHTPEISESHYTDISPTNVGHGNDERELKSRGVFLRGVPRIASHSEIFQNIRGGTIDQVSLQGREGPLIDINIFFTTQAAAKAYANYVTDHGGIFWYSERLPSEASLIPSRDPGLLNMDEETAKAVADNFTRCISISEIPLRVCESQLRTDIQSQTRRFRIDYEAFEFKYVDSAKGRTAAAEIRFPSVKICMASIETLRALDAYKECVMTPVKDGCAGPLSELEGKWRVEYEWCKAQGIFRNQRFPITTPADKGQESNEGLIKSS
ncbi:unnamed protein product [Tuber aestivum]|uniref:Uncharacterized protein n=1 Tax=Tuber aestivum TaxID=59557 RepID=A0A292PZ67_9PEZI|nr:unnamed protein product [Tuber aestivum]